MILEETINKLLRDTVNLILGDSSFTVSAKQKDAVRKSGPYADVDFTSDTSIGWEQRSLEDNIADLDVTETIEGNREIMMSIGFYRAGAVDNARKVRTAVIRESVQDLFRSVKLGLVRRSDVREISEPLASGFEERAQFDIVLSTIGSDSDIITSIQSIDIAGEFQARGIPYNFNIEVQ